MEEQKESASTLRSSGGGLPEKSQKERIVEACKPYIYCIFSNLCLGGNNIVSKITLNNGMSQYVFVVYAHAVATLTTAILAFLFERNNKSKLTLPVLRDIFFLGLLGAVLGRTLFYAGLVHTTPAFASAMANLLPSITFILAVLCRMEKIEIYRHSTQAKIVGTLVAFGGAVLMTLYKGMVLVSFHNHSHLPGNKNNKVFSDGKEIKGSILLLISYISFSIMYILQTSTIKKYPAPITLTSLTCLSGTFLSIILTSILDHKASSWRLSWNIALLGIFYSGIIFYGVTAYVQTLVLRTRGPVFTTAFRPLSTIFTALLGLLILGDALYLGGALGATLIILGLYTLLWGKEIENKNKIIELTESAQGIEIKSAQGIEIKSESC